MGIEDAIIENAGNSVVCVFSWKVSRLNNERSEVILNKSCVREGE